MSEKISDDRSIQTATTARSGVLTADPTKQKLNEFERENAEAARLKAKRELRADPERLREAVKKMTPDEIFALFDDDGSGVMNFEEFRKLLPALGIEIGEAKAFRYFNLCDTDGSGEIDVDEFRVALFVCDPSAGNPAGFSPNKLLTPMDAFETFDEDGVGYLDEDEFYFAMEYLGLTLTDYRHEKFFQKIDVNKTGTIDYLEFREVFLRVCNVRQELENRGVEIPSFAFRKTLVDMLREILTEEEDRERRAIAETKRYKAWLYSIRDKKRYLRRAQWRAYVELRSALDAAGQVYVFGEGSNGQFRNTQNSQFKTRGQFNFQHFDKILSMWQDRVLPEELVERLKIQRRAEDQEEKRYEAKDPSGHKQMGALTTKETKIDPFEEAQLSPFTGLHAAVNTATLWARRIHHVAVTESVIFAMTDSGSIYTWGGNNYFWHEIQPDSLYQTKWRGDVTPRSQLLLGVQNREIPADLNNHDGLADIDSEKPEEDRRAEVIKVVTKYYNCWEPPPNAATRMHYLEKELLAKVEYNTIKFSLECRGKKVSDVPKLELVEELYNDIILERRLLGDRAHKAIKELENQVAVLKRKRKFNLAIKTQKKIEVMWEPLKEVQAEQRAKEKADKQADIHNKEFQLENNYVEYRKRLVHKNEDLDVAKTARGNSVQIDLHGITPRGPEVATPRGYQGGIQISAGASHVCLIHKSGQLYSWGLGASGRLGLDMTEKGDPQKDVAKPTLVQALQHSAVIRVSCGQSHTGAITDDGSLFMWGSTSLGKCGLVDKSIDDSLGAYCAVPTSVVIGNGIKLRKISCGSCHTAVVTDDKRLYIFGCGDGGRLGIGEDKYGTLYQPTLVECLLHEKIVSVSCGNTSTVALTEISYQMVGVKGYSVKKMVGGKVYIAGSGNVFGRQYSKFTLLESMKKIPVKQASAGYQHTALVSAEGEMYCWGRNKDVCCGTAPHVKFIEHPLPVACLFRNVTNLALGCPAEQSSTYNSRDATFATCGDIDGYGLRHCTCTQQDAQAWLEIDLGKFALIDEIRLWNRTDRPTDPVMSDDTYTSRLFPCWVMIGQEPFDRSEGGMSLQNSIVASVAKVKFTEDQRVSIWRCPSNTQGRYIRVQLEGFNYLHIAQLEVMGNWGISSGVGRVSYVAAGRDVTVAVIRARTDPIDIESMYKRAVYCDAENAEILRQFETYALEYDKFGRGEVLKKCNICRGTALCEICLLNRTFKEELDAMPAGIGGRRRRLKSIDDYLINGNKPALVLPPIKRLTRPSWWDDFSERWRYRLNPTNWFRRRRKIAKIGPGHEKMVLGSFPSFQEESEDPFKAFMHRDMVHADDRNSDGNSLGKQSSLNSIGHSKIGHSTANSVQFDQESIASHNTASLVGTMSESGHMIKNPYPNSLGSKIDESKSLMKERKQKKKKDQSDKYAVDSSKKSIRSTISSI